MKMKVKKKVATILLVLVFLIGILSIALPIATVGASPTSPTDWSVQYMIDQSQIVGGYSQFSDPRNNRGLALSPDGQYLYAGYNNPNLNPPAPAGRHDKQVRKIDTTVADYTDATVAILQGDRGKAIATDDQGRVYLAEGSDTDTIDGPGIVIYDADLSTKLLTIPLVATGLSKPEGVAVTREAGQLVLYVTDRSLKTLNRFLITEGPPLSATKDPGPTYPIAIGAELRGVEVDPAGKIWMAGYGANKVFRVNSDGTGLTSTNIATPMDIGFCCGMVFVTQYQARTVIVLNQDDLSVVDTLTPPWTSLELDPDGQDGTGALSGIAVSKLSGTIYVANEAGQTANEHSTYGRTDSESGLIGDKFYTDMTHDDNGPILKIERHPSHELLGAAASLWLNLANTDDIGTYFDVKVDVMKGDSVVAFGTLDCLKPARVASTPVSISLTVTDPVAFDSGETFSLKVSVRIGQGAACLGKGHKDGTLQLQYDSVTRNSNVYADFDAGDTATGTYYLHQGNVMNTDAPTLLKASTVNRHPDRTKGGNPWIIFATWTSNSLP
jgi:hypothetical protein